MDISDFTSLAERLDPEEITGTLNTCFAEISQVIRRYDGTIDKYIGDCVMALFGAPAAHEDDPERAVRAALEIIQSLEELKQSSSFALNVHIGINTGLAIAGNIGDEQRMQYTVIGDAVNLAARIQEAAQPGQVLVGEAVYRLTKEVIDYAQGAELSVKGKSGAVRVYIARRAYPWRPRLQLARQRGLTPFVGRELEFPVLQAALWKAVQGRGVAIGIRGEPGIGKSRLLHELQQSLDPGVLYLEGHCLPYGRASAYQCLIPILRQYWRLPEPVTSAGRERLIQQLHGLEEYLPCFEQLLSLPSSDPSYFQLSAQVRRLRTFEGLAAVFQQAASAQPLVLAIDDLHWVDPTSQQFISTFLDGLESHRILLLLLSRPEFDPPWREHPAYSLLSLPLLPTPNGRRLIRALFDAEVAPQLEEFILQRTGGNPFFAEELTRALRESQALKRNGSYALAMDPQELQIPDTVQGVLAARIDNLRDEKRTLQVASVIGQEFAVPILGRVLQSNRSLQEQLGCLSEAEFIYPQPPDDSAYAFKHALTRDVAYETLLRRSRQQLHRQVGDAIKELLPDIATTQPEILAHHYTEAALPEQAIPYWHQAGVIAVQRCANAEAITHLTRGLELVRKLPDTTERAEQELAMQATLSAALIESRGFAAPEVGATFARARELSAKVRETPLLFRALRGLYGFHLVRGNMQAIEELGKQLVGLSQQSTDDALPVEAHHVLGMALFHMGRFTAAQEHLKQAVSMYVFERHRSHGHFYGFDPAVSSMAYDALALCNFGCPDQAVNRMGEAVALAEELDHAFSAAYARSCTALIHQHRGDPPAAQAWAEAALAVSTEYGFPHWLAWANVLRGWALTMQGEAEEGIRQLRSGIEIHRSIGSHISLPTELGILAEACLSARRIEEGLAAVDEGLGEVYTRGEAWWSAELHRLKGELLLALAADRQTDAETCFRQAIAVAQHQSAKYFELRATTSLARLLCTQGLDVEARKMLHEIYSSFTEGFDTQALQEARDLLEE